MKGKLKLIAGNLLVTLILLMVVETVFYLIRPKQSKDVGFLVNIGQATGRVDDPGYGNTEVDALLGYNKAAWRLKEQGFKTEHGCIVLADSGDSKGALNILITGGSESDISLHPANWPAVFNQILNDHGIKARIYVAAVGGYNSGQEMLQLFRDGLSAAPFIHISFSGVHDIQSPTYVTGYEQAFYEKEFGKSNTSWLLPNTVLFMRHVLGLNYPDVFLRPNISVSSVKFWERNMSIMHSAAVEYQYNFVGILEPPGADTGEVNKLYPEMRQAVVRHPDYLVDMSVISDTGFVAKHADLDTNAEQQMIATNIYQMLLQKNLLPK